MTKRAIQEALETHRAQLGYAKHMLDSNYYLFEEIGEESKWLNIYIKHKNAVEWLEKQIPDDL